MSDTTTVTPEDQRPPVPTEKLPPGYQWIWVGDRTDRRGQFSKGHWRKWPLRMKKRIPKKSGPTAGKPRNTSRLHAVHVWERLATPLAFLYGVQYNTRSHDGSVEASLRDCIEAVKLARDFVNRFTGGDDEVSIDT